MATSEKTSQKTVIGEFGTAFVEFAKYAFLLLALALGFEVAFLVVGGLVGVIKRIFA